MTKKNNKQKISTELEIIITFFTSLILMPFRFALMLFGKEKFSRVMLPFTILGNALTNAKFTFYMILANFLMFFISILFLLNHIDTLVLYPSDLINPVRWFAFLTHGFLHVNLTHLFGNILALFVFGRIVEKEIGPKKTSIVYFSALLFAGIFSATMNLIQGSAAGGVGASGAIMGLVSAAILLAPFRITFAALIPLPIMVLGWLMIYVDITGFFSGANTGIGYAAHIGGFLSAALLFFFLGKEKQRLMKGLIINTVTLIVFLGVYFLILK